MPSKAIDIQVKLAKHAAIGDENRVRDYLLACAGEWPDPEACPINPTAIRSARQFLADRGWRLRDSPTRGLVLVDPEGGVYASHRDGIPKVRVT